jgi:predicted nuclease with TOPRIM domain
VQDNQQSISGNLQLQQLLGTGLSGAKDLAKYKSENKAALEELSAKFKRIEQNEVLITEKFRQAAQYKLNEKYKQYLELKTQEFTKQAEAAKLVNPLIASFMEAKDTDQVISRLDEFDAKYEAIRKEIVDLQAQSDQLAKANPTLIK